MIIFLFIGQITTTVVGIVIGETGQVNSTLIAFIFYFCITLILTISYLICAIKIIKKLGISGRKNINMHRMALRFGGSTIGYILTMIMYILGGFLLIYPWPYRIILNLAYIFLNFTASFQIWGFKPVSRKNKSKMPKESININSS